MTEAALEMNISSLKEMVLDEEKLVTYVSLSKDLCLHVNDSKLLLCKFIENTKNSPDMELNVSYIVSGLSEDNKARTTVASEKEIASIKATFKTVFFEHIYSVSRAQHFVDKVSLLAVNKLEDLPLCTGLIKSSSCTKRTVNEIGNLKASAQVKIDEGTGNEQHKPLKNGHAETKPVKTVQETKSEPVMKTEKLSPNKDAATDPNKKPESKKTIVKSQKGIAGFFNKSNSAPSVKTVKELVQKKHEVLITKKEEKLNESKINVEKMEVDELETPKKMIKTENKKQEDKSKNKSLDNIKKNAKVDKKRKRVLQISDSSESEDERNDPFADELAAKADSEDEIPPTPSVNTVKITSGITNPKKKRKIIDKTYTDEEGYILTKKVEVYESCSENEEDHHAKENIQAKQPVKIETKTEVSPTKDKKNRAKNSKKKISPPQKGKQATLMNFFKKV